MTGIMTASSVRVKHAADGVLLADRVHGFHSQLIPRLPRHPAVYYSVRTSPLIFLNLH
jgi:hypothetical protein